MLPDALMAAKARAAEEFRGGATIESIQAATAITWAGRALEAYENFVRTTNFDWLRDADEYMHEALEHAALHPDPAVLDEVRGALLAAKAHFGRSPSFAP
jgi:hypothetical protein